MPFEKVEFSLPEPDGTEGDGFEIEVEPSSAKPLEKSKNEKVSSGSVKKAVCSAVNQVKSWISKLWTILRNQIEVVKRLIRRMK
jgi:hypothetical protein